MNWTVTSDGDGVDEFVEYRLNFARQIWSEFDALSLGFTGANAEVVVIDADQGEFSLGVFSPSDSAKIQLRTLVPANKLDHVTGLALRFREADWGGLHATVSQAISLRQIELIDQASAPFSQSFSPDIDQGWRPQRRRARGRRGWRWSGEFRGQRFRRRPDGGRRGDRLLAQRLRRGGPRI